MGRQELQGRSGGAVRTDPCCMDTMSSPRWGRSWAIGPHGLVEPVRMKLNDGRRCTDHVQMRAPWLERGRSSLLPTGPWARAGATPPGPQAGPRPALTRPWAPAAAAPGAPGGEAAAAGTGAGRGAGHLPAAEADGGGGPGAGQPARPAGGGAEAAPGGAAAGNPAFGGSRVPGPRRPLTHVPGRSCATRTRKGWRR